MIDSDEKRIKALKLYPIEEVWGISDVMQHVSKLLV